MKLKQVSNNSWATNNPVEYSFGWWETKCTTICNLYLKKRKIALTDENYIINTLGSAPGCQPQEEQCVTKENTLTWNPNVFIHKCHYKYKGLY